MADSRSSDESQQEENSEEEETPGGEELNLEEVLRLGGTQADYILLAAINDSTELVDGGMKGAIDDLEEGELEGFISKLGIRAHTGSQSVPDQPEGGAAADHRKGKKAVEASAADQVSSSQSKIQKKKEVVPVPPGKKPKQNPAQFEFQPRQVLLIKPGRKWFELEYASEGSDTPQDAAVVSRYKALAQRLFESEVELYRTKKNLQRGANSAWMKTVVSSGALADRMAAMTLLVQDAPVHMLEHVETLVSMVKRKGSRRMGLMALDTLRELLLSDLLPEHRKLRPFAQRPFDQLEERASGNRDARDRRLILWYFEHQLKQQVAEFVAALDEVGHDTVAATKAKALAAAHELLSGRPEQERALLVQVVNKLGDPDYKMAAKAAHLLETLLHNHPNMKAVVCCEVERLMFRPNVGAKAQYYAVCFLSQVMLSHDEAPLAAKLIAVYFSFFGACVKKKDVESKMLSALLTGVNRAYPYADAGDEKVREQLDTLFRVVHLAKFNTAVQALMLLFQVLDAQQSVSDRFYVALYRKLLDPGLAAAPRQSLFLNLLFKALKADVAPRRVKAFAKRLLQVAAQQGACFAAGALFLVSELMKAKPGLRMLLQQGEDGAEEDEEFKDVCEERRHDEEEEEEESLADKPEGGVAEPETRPTASWVHHQNLEGGRSSQNYDPVHRNPLFCGADRSPLWELHRLSLHFHPSVSLFARTVLQGEPVQYTGDPLQDFTLIRFLDRFVFRNPKQLRGKRENPGSALQLLPDPGSVLIQFPVCLSENTDSAALRPKQRFPVGSLPVNGVEFLSRDESQIPVDQVFFHRFFKKRQQEKQSRRPRPDGDDESVESVDDDEFEEALNSLETDFTNVPDGDLDFAGNVRSKKGRDSEDSDLEDDLDDEEVSLGSMDEEDFGEDGGGTFMDPDEDDGPELEDGEDEDVPEGSGEEAELPAIPQTRKRKSSKEPDFSGPLEPDKEKKRRKDRGVFASAEEFGSLLDENTDCKLDNIGLNAMANSDRAGLKQLKWESQRDDWIHGRDSQTLRRRKSSFIRRKTRGRGAFRRNRK
ncbi:PREDICTED: CCAAT/enhancer-binding protein zeta isoform X2 [Poecilia mexicana]|uniref:CCAAT/enhancer-binding protein zeta isoform X2 n=1 Tax=Poecilia mexicana TaxID=48701 RepID=UPI00072ECD40|nr:PREDICTED: CCAAT/enhancer-binding protein zeta isoform X2 [Poecilia mexicana]